MGGQMRIGQMTAAMEAFGMKHAAGKLPDLLDVAQVKRNPAPGERGRTGKRALTSAGLFGIMEPKTARGARDAEKRKVSPRRN